MGTVEQDKVFTIDSLRARKKLAGSQLAPGLWLVKLVQAGVVSGATGEHKKHAAALPWIAACPS